MYSVIINTNCGAKCLLNAGAIDICLCLAYAIGGNYLSATFCYKYSNKYKI